MRSYFFFPKIKSQCVCISDRFIFLGRLWKYIKAKSRIAPGTTLHWLEEKIASNFPTEMWSFYLSNDLKKLRSVWILQKEHKTLFSNTRSPVQHSRCCFSAWSRPRFRRHCRHRTPLLPLRRRTNRQAGVSPGKIASDHDECPFKTRIHLYHESNPGWFALASARCSHGLAARLENSLFIPG